METSRSGRDLKKCIEKCIDKYLDENNSYCTGNTSDSGSQETNSTDSGSSSVDNPKLAEYSFSLNTNQKSAIIILPADSVSNVIENSLGGVSKIETKDANIKELKQRFKIVEAEIQAGNNNPVVKAELKEIINKLVLYQTR